MLLRGIAGLIIAPMPGASSPARRRILALSGKPRPEAGFVVEDGHYLSARFPGDAWVFARCFLAKVEALPDRASPGAELPASQG